jgi:hypothetical protein
MEFENSERNVIWRFNPETSEYRAADYLPGTTLPVKVYRRQIFT